MFQLPPIKHKSGTTLEYERKSSSGKEYSSASKCHLEPQRRQSEPTMVRSKPTVSQHQIRLTEDSNDVEVFDLGSRTVREAMGSPIPRSLKEDSDLGSVVLSRGGHPHPRITIDMCVDSQKTLGFGQSITRSLSANTLLMAPYPMGDQDQRKGKSRSVGNPGLGSKLSYGLCASEGNIPLTLAQSETPNSTLLGKVPAQNFREYSQLYGRKNTKLRTDEQVPELTLADLHHRPNSPVPRKTNGSYGDFDYHSSTTPLRVSVTPPVSPRMSPKLSPSSREMTTLSACSDSDISPSFPSNNNRLSPLTPPLSPQRSVRVSPSRGTIMTSLTPPLSPEWKRHTASTPVSPRKSSTPEHTPSIGCHQAMTASLTLLPRHSERHQGRLLPLRSDNTEA